MKKVVLYIVLITIFTIVISAWWTYSGYLLSTGQLSSVLLSIARLAGLLATVLMLLQLILIGRVKWVESVFGLDKLSRQHRTNGLIILGLILVHVGLMIFSYAKINELDLWGQFVTFLLHWRYVLWAFIGFVILLITIGLSLTIVRRKLKYEWWYYVHIFNYLSFVLIIWHQVQTTPETQGSWMHISWITFWYGLYIFAFSNLIWFRFIRPLIRFARHKFTVSRIEDLGLATSIYISGQNMVRFKIKAGQFFIFRFLQKGYWAQAHPFSMSMAPNGKEVRLTAKKLGDFTNTLPQIKVGTQVVIDGPHGVFTEQLITKDKLLFIAGGIGITPIRSMLEELGNRYPDKLLLYSNKTPAEAILAVELNNLSQKSDFKIINIYNDEKVSGAENGRLDKIMLMRLVPDIAKRDVFLCGPPPMMVALRSAMIELGVPKSQIHFERFAL